VIPARPTLHAIVQAAVEATGADRGWLLAAEDDVFVVAAAYGHAEATVAVGVRRKRAGIAGFVFASGQPAAIQPRPDDVDNVGAGGAVSTPVSVLAVPCVAEEARGVLELVDAVGGAFSFDDVETTSLLAEVAAAALAELLPAWEPPAPERLTVLLASLARRDPARYAEVARFFEVMT
jgi:GAF domain-containing protein